MTKLTVVMLRTHLVCCWGLSFNDFVSPPLAVGFILTEMCAEMVSISKEKHRDSPISPGSKQTINGSTLVIAI